MALSDPASPRTIVLGEGHEVTVERPNGLKASRALAMLREVTRETPALSAKVAQFTRDYERDNVVELDRVQAKMEFQPRAVTERDDDGQVVAVLDGEGRPLMLPSPVDRLTEEDWARTGNVYRVPRTPGPWEVGLALFDDVMEAAESLVWRLLALFTIPNEELFKARKAGTDEQLIQERADDLLGEAFADDLIELAVVVSETMDHHFRRKANQIGSERLGNLARSVGLGRFLPTATTPAPSSTSAAAPSSLKPNSSTDSPANTADGDLTPSSKPPSTSSWPSETSAPETETPSEPSESEPRLEGQPA